MGQRRCRIGPVERIEVKLMLFNVLSECGVTDFTATLQGSLRCIQVGVDPKVVPTLKQKPKWKNTKSGSGIFYCKYCKNNLLFILFLLEFP